MGSYDNPTVGSAQSKVEVTSQGLVQQSLYYRTLLYARTPRSDIAKLKA